MTSAAAHEGGCECRGIRYRVTGLLRPVTVCHCGQCRRTHGDAAGYTAAARDDFALTSEETLTWYRSSEKSRRGFCRRCGGSLFFDTAAKDYISIAAGTFDGPLGVRTVAHIYCADMLDYEVLPDSLPHYPVLDR